MHFGKKLSTRLTKLLQEIVISKNIDIYIIPPDVEIELSFVNTNE